MNIFQELRQRRVFQITSAYVVGSWGLLQFLAFLENRMAVSPNLVNLIGLALLFLLPAVVILAWVHGRPGRDTWGRTPKVVVAANIIAALLLIGFMFQGRDLGGVTQTVAVADENGVVAEHVVPKSEYVRRILLFPPDGDTVEDDWARQVSGYLLGIDLFQDAFIDVVAPNVIPSAFAAVGYPDGKDVPRPLQRKLARDGHMRNFLTGKVARQAEGWRLDTELHESESGKLVASRTFTGSDLFTVIDAASRQLRLDLDIPAVHVEGSVDLPVAEITSSDIEAVSEHVQANMAVRVANDWAGAVPHLDAVIERDPEYAQAQFLRFAVLETLGDSAAAAEAIDMAMKNLYRVPERLQFVIKSQYYYSVKQDADKGLAVLQMWTRLHPDDIAALDQLALYSVIRQDLPAATAAYERILEIDPSRMSYLEKLAQLYTQQDDQEAAERCLKRHVEMFPTSPRGYENLSDYYSSIGRFEEARAALDEALLLDPEKESLILSTIDLDLKFGRYEAAETAIDDLTAAATTDRSRLRADSRRLMLENTLARTDRLIATVESFHTSLRAVQNPLQADLVYSMTLPALSIAGRPEESLRRLADIRTNVPAPYDDLIGVGEAWALADLGRTAEARESLDAAVAVVEQFKFETFRATIFLVEGKIHQADGDLDQAIEHYRTAVATSPVSSVDYHRLLIQGLRLAGKTDEADAALADAVATDPAHPMLLLEQAHLAMAHGRTAEARRHLDVVLATWREAHPDHPLVREANDLAGRLGSS